MYIFYQKDIEALEGQSSKNENTGNICFKSISNKFNINLNDYNYY